MKAINVFKYRKIFLPFRMILIVFIFCNFSGINNTSSFQNVFDVRKYGAVGDGKINDAKAIQKAIDACSKAGGGTILLPAGYVFMSGPLQLASDIDFHIEGGTKLLASPDTREYRKSAFRQNPGEGTIWIGADNVRNLIISGSGSIDGNGIAFMGAELEDSYELKPFNIIDPRPHVLTLVGCTNVRIKDVHIGNAAYWTIHLAGCNDVVVSGITLLNSLKVRNSDGIDIDHSKNIRISDCYIESGDDCICFKNRREYEEFGHCENITVSNCTMTGRSCAIKIGSENMDTIRQVTISNCIIKNSNRGIGIQNRDEGVVSDIIFSNILVESHLYSDVWWGKAEPIYITAYRRAKGNNKDANWRFPKGATEGRVGEVRNISFSNIKCTSENGVYVSGESVDKVSNIFFDQVDVFVNKITALPGGIYDRRPCEAEGFVKGHSAAFYFDAAGVITMRNCSVKWGDNLQDYYTYAIESNKVDSLGIVNFSGTSAFPTILKSIKR